MLTDSVGGGVRVIDFAPRFRRFGRVFRPPMLIRRIEPVSGHPRIRLRLRPRFGYGADTPDRRTGSNHLRFVTSGMSVRVTTDLAVSYLAEEVELICELRAGDGEAWFELGSLRLVKAD